MDLNKNTTNRELSDADLERVAAGKGQRSSGPPLRYGQCSGGLFSRGTSGRSGAGTARTASGGCAGGR